MSAALSAVLGALIGAPAMGSPPVRSEPPIAMFGPPAEYQLSTQGTAFDMASGDFTGTHTKDIVVADGASGAVSLLANRGDGTFAPAVTVHSEPGRSITAIATGDFNGDGLSDLVIVSEGAKQQLVLLLGDGHRHFAVSARVPLKFLAQFSPLIFGGTRSIAVGSFTHPGVLDAAVTEGVNFISVFSGDGRGGFTGRQDLIATALPRSVIGANLFGTGLLDIGAVDFDSSSVYTIANHGNGTFAARKRSKLGILPTNAQPVSLASGDFRRLGRSDLFAVYSATGSPDCNCIGKVLLSNGRGSYGKAKDVPISGAVDFPSAGAVGDFDGDGIPDLAAVAERVGSPSTNVVVVLPGNGDGTFSTAAQTTISVAMPSQTSVAIPDKMIVDDFKGDGKPSIAFSFDRTTGWGIAVLLNTTGGSPRARVLHRM